MKKIEKDVVAELKSDYARWQELFEKGGRDPTWADGCNLNLVRGHIAGDKIKLEKQLSEMELTEQYYQPIPPVLPDSYMARSREIWYHALQSYKKYLESEDYQYLCQIQDCLSKKIEKETCIRNVTGYAVGLKMALQQNDFVSLRRHENPESYLESFKDCREHVGALLLKEKEEPEKGQLDLFQMGMMR
ncbi:MAG: hypothetical protein ACK5MN_02675 [Lachnospiraceae bacterium]